MLNDTAFWAEFGFRSQATPISSPALRFQAALILSSLGGFAASLRYATTSHRAEARLGGGPP
jgi:hypothetical protein